MCIMHESMTINDYQCYECHINYTCWYIILFIDDDDDEVDVHDPFELWYPQYIFIVSQYFFSHTLTNFLYSLWYRPDFPNNRPL